MVYIRNFQTVGCNPKWSRANKFWGCGTNWLFVLCPANFENASSAAKLFEKIMVIAHLINKSETKIDKSELDSE